VGQEEEVSEDGNGTIGGVFTRAMGGLTRSRVLKVTREISSLAKLIRNGHSIMPKRSSHEVVQPLISPLRRFFDIMKNCLINDNVSPAKRTVLNNRYFYTTRQNIGQCMSGLVCDTMAAFLRK
jgi:hypothetical protein